MSGSSGKRFLMRFAISALVAMATPAVAAGLVAGASVAMATGNTVLGSTIYPSEQPLAPTVDNRSYLNATHGPAQLSILAGNDQAAWDSAHSVHVEFPRKPR